MEKLNRKRVVVITGASAGVGRATARAFAKEGAKIGLIARGRKGLEAAKREVEALGGEALVLPLDVSDHETLEAAAQRVEEHFGPIDVWINNAMLSVFSPIKEMQAEEYKRVTEVTYLGYVYGTQSALKRMLPRNKGLIIQVGSALAYRSIPLQSAYCAAKHAISGFTESLRTELIHDDSAVKVTEVHLPAVNTTQFGWSKSRLPRKAQPVPPIFEPEFIADTICWASHHPRREIWVAWPTVKAILADKLVPGLADWYLGKYGYESQQTDEPVDPDRKDNLWSPIDEDRGAHGSFGEQSRQSSLELFLAKNRGTIASLALGTLGVLALGRIGKALSLPSSRLQ